jgi:hypothetical protein
VILSAPCRWNPSDLSWLLAFAPRRPRGRSGATCPSGRIPCEPPTLPVLRDDVANEGGPASA